MKFQIGDICKVVDPHPYWNKKVVKIIELTTFWAVCALNDYQVEINYGHLVKLTKLERSLL